MHRHIQKDTWHRSSSLFNHSSSPLPSHSMWDKSITRWRQEEKETHTLLRERGHQVDSSPCQGIYPLPVTMIMITVSDTGCVMVTVATLPPDLTLLNASSLLLKSFYLTLGPTHTHAKITLHSQKTCTCRAKCRSWLTCKQHLGEKAEQTQSEWTPQSFKRPLAYISLTNCY